MVRLDRRLLARTGKFLHLHRLSVAGGSFPVASYPLAGELLTRFLRPFATGGLRLVGAINDLPV
jgi:hypothetical protein